MEKNVVIIGAGWLGEALGQRLLTGEYNIQMTSRDFNKATQPDWALLNCESDKIQHNISLLHAVWVFCIPAGRTEQAQTAYRHYLKAAISLATTLNMKAFILCSTTSVYADNQGIYQESDAITPTSARQTRLLENELLVAPLGNQATVVRLAGLFGPNRHPGKFFINKQPSSNGAETVNMTHQTDAIKAIQFIIEHIDDIEGTPPILNLVTPEHPTKAHFYRQAALSLNLPAPKFDIDEPKQRIISSQLLTDLGYQFHFDTLADALNSH